MCILCQRRETWRTRSNGPWYFHENWNVNIFLWSPSKRSRIFLFFYFLSFRRGRSVWFIVVGRDLTDSHLEHRENGLNKSSNNSSCCCCDSIDFNRRTLRNLVKLLKGIFHLPNFPSNILPITKWRLYFVAARRIYCWYRPLKLRKYVKKVTKQKTLSLSDPSASLFRWAKLWIVKMFPVIVVKYCRAPGKKN